MKQKKLARIQHQESRKVTSHISPTVSNVAHDHREQGSAVELVCWLVVSWLKLAIGVVLDWVTEGAFFSFLITILLVYTVNTVRGGRLGPGSVSFSYTVGRQGGAVFRTHFLCTLSRLSSDDVYLVRPPGETCYVHTLVYIII